MDMRPKQTDEQTRRIAALLDSLARLKRIDPKGCKKLLDHFGGGKWSGIPLDKYDVVQDHAEDRIASLTE